MSNNMKTFLQCVKEAAELLDKPYTYDYINKISTEETEKLFNKAADIYASQSKSTIPVVMQAEGSEGAKGAAVGNSAAGKGVSGGIISCPNCGQGWDLTKNNACSCGAQLRGELLR